MTPERARYILDSKLLGGDLRYAFRMQGYNGRLYDDGMTRAEYAFVREYWMTLPGGASFYSALCEVARMDDVAAEGSGGPGYPGPCPEGMDWSSWLAFNNVD